MADHDDGPPPARVLLAVGNPQRERRLARALAEAGLAVAERCLDAPTLVERAAAPDVHVVLAATDLHRISPAVVAAVRDHRLPIVLTAAESERERYAGLAHVLPDTATPERLAAAVGEVLDRHRSRQGRPGPMEGAALPVEDRVGDLPADEGVPGRVFVMTSGKGAPGTTTVAIGVAAALGALGRRVVLVDAEPRGGSVVPYLDLDPRPGLLTLAAGGNGAHSLAHLGDALQLFGRLMPQQRGRGQTDGHGFAVLGGIERPELAPQVPTSLLLEAVAALRRDHDDVLVDLGAWPSRHGGLAGVADRALLVAVPDLIGLWNAQLALRSLRDAVREGAVALVLNRRRGRVHYDTGEAERALGVPVLASIPDDGKAARFALQRQAPLTSARGRAPRELERLADRLAAEPREGAALAAGQRMAFWRRKEAVR